jgi:hypothetical protein
MRIASSLLAAHVMAAFFGYSCTCLSDRKPCLCEPRITRKGPFLAPHPSKWMRIVSIRETISELGRTWLTPALIDHGPQPGISFRSMTEITQS